MPVHIIYRSVEHPQIRDAREVVGVVNSGWRDADLAVERLNKAAEGLCRSLAGTKYWKEEAKILLVTLPEEE